MNKDEIKDKAAQQMGYESFKDYWEYQMKAHSWTEEVQFREHYAELHTASAIAHFKQQVREALPLEITPDELQQDYEDRRKDYGSEFASGFCDGGQYYFQLLLEEVKELLK